MTDLFNINKLNVGDDLIDDNLVADVELGDKAAPQIEFLSRGQHKLLIATISLCMLSYARNTRSNILQVAMGYFAFADNSTKQIMEILHCLGVQVTYKIIRQILQENANRTSALLQKKA